MRALLLAGCLLSTLAWADVPSPFPKATCNVPAGCVACATFDTDCKDAAVDAGLVLSDCTDRRGVPTQYVCPPGHPATSGCGCSSAQDVALLAAGVLTLGLRRRR